MSIGKYAGFDNDNIRIPQMPNILGRSGPWVETTYKFEKVFYKIGNEWFKQDFTVTTRGDSAAAKRLLLGAVMKSRTFTEQSEREKRHSFAIVYQNGDLNVICASNTSRYNITQEDLEHSAKFTDEGNLTRIERARGRVESLREQYETMWIDLASLSETRNNRYLYYLPGSVRRSLFGEDPDELIEKIQSQKQILERMEELLGANAVEDARLKQQILNDPAPQNHEALEALEAFENRVTCNINGRVHSLRDLEKRVDDLYSRFGPIEQRYLALKKQITESQ